MSKNVKYINQDFQIFNSAQELADEQQRKLREELENKNPPFIQLVKGVAPNLVSKMSKSAITVFMFLLDNLDMQDANTIAVSQSTIASELNLSRQTIAKGIKELEKLKVIAIGKVGQANIYMINPDVAWMNGHKKKNSMVLKGTILLGKEENQKLFQAFAEVEKKSLHTKKTRINQLNDN